MTAFFRPNIPRFLASILCLLSIFILCLYPLSASSFEQQKTPFLLKILDETAINSLAYRSMLFEYYSGNLFEAATQILAQEKTGHYGDEHPYPHRLLSGIYLGIGMTRNAEQQLEFIPGSSDFHNQYRLSLAEIYYQQSGMKEMHRVLASPSDSFTATQADKRNHLLGLFQLHQNKPSLAIEHFNLITKSSEIYPFARFNTAIALVKSNKLDSATKELEALLARRENTEEAILFRDRVALSLGEIFLLNKQARKAKFAFREVRLNSPYAAPALLGLGWSYHMNKKPKAALSPWLKLEDIDTNSPDAQQNLLLIPRYYESLGAMKDALAAYNHARTVYIRELNEIKRARQAVNHPHWLKSLLENNLKEQSNAQFVRTNDLHKQLVAHDIITNSIGADRLFQRYASKEFHHWLKQFIQLEALNSYLSLWQEQLPIYNEMINDRKIKQKILNQRITQALIGLSKASNNEIIRSSKEKSQKEDSHWLSLMTQKEQHSLDSLHSLTTRLKKLDSSLFATIQQNTLQARINSLKGSLYWKISRNKLSRQEKLNRELKKLEKENEKLRKNQQDILSAQRVMQRKLEPYQLNIRDLLARIRLTQRDIKTVNLEQRKYLQSFATQALDQQEKQLSHFLSVAELSIARLHESAVFKSRRK